jgi:hypothetical protein
MNNTAAQSKATIFLRGPSQADCRQAAEALGAHVIREYVEDRDRTSIRSIDKRPALRLMLDEYVHHVTRSTSLLPALAD